MGSRIVFLLLTALALAPGAGAAPVATIVEGESTITRDATRYVLAEGVRLAPDDIIETFAQTRLLRIEFDDGVSLLVAPESRLWLAPKFGGDKAAARATRLYLLQGTIKLSAKGDAGPVATPLIDLKSTGRDTVVSLAGGNPAVFAEAGDVEVVERTKAKGGATVGGAPLVLKSGEFFVRSGADKAKVAPRPDAEFIQRLPRAFLDAIPPRAALFAGREVEPKPLGPIAYSDAQPWIDAEAALRPAFLVRWRGLANRGDFRKGLVAGMRAHPEWDRTLFPEKYLPKPKPASSAAPASPKASAP